MDVSIIFSAIDLKVERLVHCDLGAGINALNHAESAHERKTFYIEQAWSAFNRAVYLEKDERLILAHIGLAMCNTYFICIESTQKYFEWISVYNLSKQLLVLRWI